MAQLSFAGGQAVGDVAQTVNRTLLAEQHGHELAPTAESFGVALGSVLVDGGIKDRARNQRENLGENAGYCGQGCALL